MIIEFASEVSNLTWRVSQSQNGGAIFTLTKRSLMFGSVVFDHQWCILIVMSVKSSFYNEYDIKNNEKHVLWAQRSFQNHHQTFHNRCPEKIGPLPKKSDHWFTRTCPENIRPAPTWWLSHILLMFLLLNQIAVKYPSKVSPLDAFTSIPVLDIMLALISNWWRLMTCQ